MIGIDSAHLAPAKTVIGLGSMTLRQPTLSQIQPSSFCRKLIGGGNSQ
jgi:hypothetical protein